uniref:Uncharacterized protein n=1 Tax=Arundo donax TaxID=35708 RepID=A0A0A8Z548_ARUDO
MSFPPFHGHFLSL